MLVSSWLSGFNPSFGNLPCLATLKSYDTTKESVCGWLYIYIYIYNLPGKKNEYACGKNKNLLGIPPKVITKIINNQLDVKLGQFMQDELDIVLMKIKNRKATGLEEILPEVWKTRKFDDPLLWYCNAVYNQKSAASSLFPRKMTSELSRTTEV